jgi:hypothetical protein
MAERTAPTSLVLRRPLLEQRLDDAFGKRLTLVIAGREGRRGGRSRRVARLRLLRGLRREQPPGRARHALRQAGAHLPVPLERRPHDGAESTERARFAGGGSGPERDQRARRDYGGAPGRRQSTCRAVVAPRQGHVPPRAARPRLDECVEHQQERCRLRLVAQAAERRRGEQPRALGRLRQGRPPDDRACARFRSPLCLAELRSSSRNSTTSTPAERSSATSSAWPPRTTARCVASTPSCGRARSAGDFLKSLPFHTGARR